MPDYLITTTIPLDVIEGDGIEKQMKTAPAKRERLVRAKNEAAALKHVVADTITIARASIDDAMRLAGAGARVEVAAEPAA